MRAGKAGGGGPSQRYETRFGPKANEATKSGAPEKKKQAGFRLSTEIKKAMDLRKVLKERILENKVELLLPELLGIAKKEFHDSIVDLVKRQRLATEPEPEKPVEVWPIHLEEDELAESHYLKLHWARATTETPVWIGDV